MPKKEKHYYATSTLDLKIRRGERQVDSKGIIRTTEPVRVRLERPDKTGLPFTVKQVHALVQVVLSRRSDNINISESDIEKFLDEKTKQGFFIPDRLTYIRLLGNKSTIRESVKVESLSIEVSELKEKALADSRKSSSTIADLVKELADAKKEFIKGK